MKRITQKALSLFLSFAMLLGMGQCAGFATAFAQAAGVADSGGVTVYYCDSGLYQDSSCKTPFSGGQETVTNVVVKDGTQTIGNSSFWGYANLTDVSIPDTVQSIETDAFHGCTRLSSINFPDSVKTIGNFAFYQSGVTNITFGSGLDTIGNDAFSNCTQLRSVSIGAAIKAINPEAFMGCSALQTVAFATGSSQLDMIDADVFHNCSSLNSINIPASVKTIGTFAFYNSGLTDIALDSGLETVDNDAFSNCAKLRSVSIGAAIKVINPEAFKGCSALQTVAFAAGSSQLDMIDADVFHDCSSLNSINIPASVKTIGTFAFYNSGLTDITLDSGLETIGNDAFSNCAKLRSVSIGAAIKDIKPEAFKGCSALQTVAFATGSSQLDMIDADVFHDCSSLNSINIPASVKTIGTFAFYNSGLTSLAIPEGVKIINTSAFQNCAHLTDVRIPTSVTEINGNAFGSCPVLQTVTFPTAGSQLGAIGDYAFDTCHNLTSINIPSSVTTIGNCAFQSNTDLASISIPNSVTSIGYHAFAGSGLKSVAIPASVITIGDGAFYDCTFLETATLSDSHFTSIAANLFDGCTSLKSVFIPSTVKAINDKAFNNCTALTSESIPNGVTSIGNYAFSGSGLTRVTIPASVASIGENAFQGCAKLTGVILKGTTPPTTGNDAFDEANATVTFLVPTGKMSVYQGVLNADVMSSSTANVVEEKDVTAISGLPGTKTVANGTAQKDLNLPSSLTVTVDGKLKTVAVTWISVPEYNPVQAGSYTFTPVLPAAEGYLLADGVGATVSITVKQPAAIVSGATGTPSLPSAVTDSPSGAQVVLSGATLPPGVTNISLSVTPETANGTQATPGTTGGAADAKGAAAFHLVISTPGLNIIGIPSLYNIKLLDQNGNPITGFNGKVTVKIPIPAGLHGTPRVFRYEESTGTLTDLGATVQDGFLVFSTDHFSYYVVAGTGNSITLDTKSYQMPVKGQYQIGLKLTGSKSAAVKFHSTSDKIATVAKLKNGNYQVTGKGTGTVWIMFDVYDSKNRLLTHASVRVDVKTGIRPRGDSTRQIGVY